VSAQLLKQDGVSYVSVSQEVKNHVSDMMKSLDYIVILVVACAAMLAFVVIYNLNNINITERLREIATIKVLGFYREETNSYVFRENSILTLAGSLLGVVLGHYLHAFVMSQIQVESVAFDVHVSGVSYLLSVVLTLLFNQTVNWVMSGRLEGIDMAESLKSVE
jgi:putative ABC transport system permease protein